MDINLIFSIAACVLSFVLTALLGKVVIPALHMLKAGQSIREIGPNWHQYKAGTPTMGGVMFIVPICLCTLIAAVLNRDSGDHTVVYVLALSLVYGLIGFADDFVKVKLKRNLGLTALQKFLLQIVVAGAFLLLLRKNGDLSDAIYIPFANVTWELPAFCYIFLSIFIIVGFVNAVNLTDGVDGLASGVTIPVMMFFAVTCFLWSKCSLGVFPAAVTGGLAGFLCYNFHPAAVFMGDTGSLFLGGAVCAMAYALDCPLVLIPVGLIYLAETLSVMMQVAYFKLTHGKRIFRMTPIHHHFEMGGWSEVKIFTVFTAITVVMCIATYFGIFHRF